MRQLGRPTTPIGSAMSNREQVRAGGHGAAGEFVGRPLPGIVIGGGWVERSG